MNNKFAFFKTNQKFITCKSENVNLFHNLNDEYLKKSKKGITLIALILTVVILMILAGIAISMLTGENSIISKAHQASEKWKNATQKEADLVADYDYSIDALEKLQHAAIDFSYTPSNLTNGDVKVGIINNLKTEGYTLEYSLNNGIAWNKYENELAISESNTLILARLIKIGLTSEVATGNVINIDKVAPISFNASSSNIADNAFTINASTIDGPATATSVQSGIKEYKYYIKKSIDSEYTSEIVPAGTTSKLYSGLTQNTIYNVYVEAYDNAGNKTTSSVINVETTGLQMNEYSNSMIIIDRDESYILTNATAKNIKTGVIEYTIEPGGEVLFITNSLGRSSVQNYLGVAFGIDVLSYMGSYVQGGETGLDCVYGDEQMIAGPIGSGDLYSVNLNVKLKMGYNEIILSYDGGGRPVGYWSDASFYFRTRLKVRNNTQTTKKIIIGESCMIYAIPY